MRLESSRALPVLSISDDPSKSFRPEASMVSMVMPLLGRAFILRGWMVAGDQRATLRAVFDHLRRLVFHVVDRGGDPASIVCERDAPLRIVVVLDQRRVPPLLHVGLDEPPQRSQ